MGNLRVKWQIIKEILSSNDAIVVTYDAHPILGDKATDKRSRFRVTHFGDSRMVVDLFWYFICKGLDNWLDYWENKNKPKKVKIKKNEAD